MQKHQIKFNQLTYYFFALLIVLLPLMRLIEQVLLYRFGFPEGLVFWKTHFYEPIINIILLLNCYILIKNRGLKSRINWTSIVVFLLIALSIFSAFLISPSISRGLEGFRFSIFFLFVFLAGYLSDFSSEQRNKLLNIYLIVAFIIALWAIVERFLPVNYLMNLHLINPDSGFGYGTHRVGIIWQSVTGIGGPNQLGSYLLPAIFIALLKITNHKSQITNLKIKTFLTILIIFGVTAVILSFSRSAWVGLYVGFFFYIILFIRNTKLKIASLAVLVIIVALGLNYYLDRPNDILTHGASNLSHQTAFQSSIQEIKNRTGEPAKLLLGSGIGTAGPAVLKYGDGFVSESWYLELALELGILGLVLWFILIALLLNDLYKKTQGLFLGLVAVSSTALFLHTFADNPAMSITLFLLVGISIYNKLDEQR